jgi:hypothetical protein
MPSIDLEKKSELVGKILLDKGVRQAPVLRVGVALDISGSMSSLYRASRGPSAVQNAFNQLMGVAVKFDDNGELDVFKFDDRAEYVGTSKPDAGDYDRYIERNGIGVRGGTNYVPIVDEAMRFFFGKGTAAPAPKKGIFGGMFGKSDPIAPADDNGNGDNTPVLMLVLTDGEPSDRRQIEQRLAETTGDPVYWHFVGINGNRSSFPTIAKLADALPNVGEVYLPRLDMSDQEIYSQLICDELIEFVAKFTGPVRAGAHG